MSHHHGMNPLSGMHAFCSQGGHAHAGNRFGRLFDLPPLYLNPHDLIELGKVNGPMDGKKQADRTKSVPVGLIFFGQFVDHDITLDISSSFSSNAEPENTPNTRTPTLDLDCVYGLGPEAHPYLYHAAGDFSGVKLLTGADVPNPVAFEKDDLARSVQGTAIIGDPRNDENRIVSQLQLGMIRFHNRVVDHLSGGKKKLSGKELFEEARRLTTWHYQWVVVNEYLVAVCGGYIVDEILACGRRLYCPNGGEPFIPIEFSVAAYRFGHSMIPPRIRVQKGGGTPEIFGPELGEGFSPISSPDAVVEWGELLDTGAGTAVQRADKLDTKMTRDLLALPFIKGGIRSLAVRNLLRGQTFLLPSGEKVAEAVGRPAGEINDVRKFAQSAAGGTIDFSHGTPLWYYLLAEAEVIGRQKSETVFEESEGLGPTGARIVAETIIGLIELDDRSWLGANRNWTPQDGLGVSTLGEML